MLSELLTTFKAIKALLNVYGCPVVHVGVLLYYLSHGHCLPSHCLLAFPAVVYIA